MIYDYTCLYLKGLIYYYYHVLREYHGRGIFLSRWYRVYPRLIESSNYNTLPKFNIAPENQWLEDVFPTEIVPFQGLC